MTEPARNTKARRHFRAALLSLVVACCVLAVKYGAYLMTGSTVVLGDALESIVNVVAAGFALGSVAFARQPADRNHPYGHGKIEFFAAVFEGGLIVFAALVILWESIHGLLEGVTVKELDAGMLLTAGATVANLVLGLYLVRIGRRERSPALEADGLHVLADVWTSVGAIVGLAVVRLTGASWVDPLAAGLMAFWLLFTGTRLVRRAAGGLLDEEDPALLERFVQALRPHVGNGVIRIHGLRAIRAGGFHHVSAHLVVPEFWNVERAHELSEQLAARVLHDVGEGEITFHLDPCRRAYCSTCDLEHCSVRRQPFTGLRVLTVDEAVQPDDQAAAAQGTTR